MNKMHSKLEAVYEFLIKFVDENGYPPTNREICRALDIKSTATVFGYLNKLDEMGKIKKAPLVNRALNIKDRYSPQSGIVSIPVVGRVAAGKPITAIENIEEEIPLPGGFFKSGELFILKVQGESMINAGIQDGDRLIFRRQADANNGDIVAALVDGEATVKRFYRENNKIRLQPENDFMSPIVVDSAEVLGVVTGLLRSYK